MSQVNKASVEIDERCLENQTAKSSKSDLHVVWPDLTNAYGPVPHHLITFALNFFHIPCCIQNLIANYFNNFYFCYTTHEVSTGWHQLDSERLFHLSCSFHSSI